MIKKVSRNIPERIKRAVRKKCHFGCVICGKPLFHYDHIEDFSVVRRHKITNLVLLCPDHHQDKTSGRISIAALKRAAENPANMNRESSLTPHSLFIGDKPMALQLDGNTFISDFNNDSVFEAITIENDVLLGFVKQDGQILFNAKFSDQNGKLILEIDRSAIKVQLGIWDYSMVGQIIEIRSDSRHVELRLLIDAETKEIRIDKCILFHGKYIIVADGSGNSIKFFANGVTVPRIEMQGNTFINSRRAVVLN